MPPEPHETALRTAAGDRTGATAVRVGTRNGEPQSAPTTIRHSSHRAWRENRRPRSAPRDERVRQSCIDNDIGHMSDIDWRMRWPMQDACENATSNESRASVRSAERPKRQLSVLP